MKKSMFKFAMTWVAFLCVLFLFEIAPAQERGIDFSVDSCSVEKVPGEDSVLVSAWIHYLVADSPAPEVDLPYVVKFDGNIVHSGWIYLPWAYNDCYEGFLSCEVRVCTSFVDNMGCVWEGKCVNCMGCNVDCECLCLYAPLGPITCTTSEPYPKGTQVTIILDDGSVIPELDENNNECSTIYTPTDIPTLTEWGLIIFGVVLIGFITWVFLRRRKVIGVRA